MKRKSLVATLSFILICLLVGCGGESGSTAQEVADSHIEDVNPSDLESTEPVTVEETEPVAEEPEADQPVEEVQEPEPVEEEEYYVEVTGNTVRVRSSISTESNDNIIGMADKGDKYIKTGVEEDWSKISFDGKEGYIKSEFVKEISKEEFEIKEVAKETVPEEKTEEVPQKAQEQPAPEDNSAALLAQQQQEALDAQLALQQAAAQQQSSASTGGEGSYENTQLRSDRIVYITPTGKKYHYDQQCAGVNAIPKNLDDVIGSYGPCGTCVLR